jgi:hypothetical protein
LLQVTASLRLGVNSSPHTAQSICSCRTGDARGRHQTDKLGEQTKLALIGMKTARLNV